MSATLETEVQHHLNTDPQYPLGETDAMKWAVAWRLIRDKNGIDASGDTDDWMVGWFANCMASEEMRLTGGSFLNADGLQSVLDGEIEAHPEFNR